MTSRIQRFGQTISTGVENFTNFSQKHLRGPAVRIIGLVAIIFGLAVLAGIGYLAYKLALSFGMPTWQGIDFALIFPYGIFSVALLAMGAMWAVPSFQYGVNMLKTKLLEPKNPRQVEGEL